MGSPWSYYPTIDARKQEIEQEFWSIAGPHGPSQDDLLTNVMDRTCGREAMSGWHEIFVYTPGVPHSCTKLVSVLQPLSTRE